MIIIEKIFLIYKNGSIAEVFFGITEDVTETGVSYLDDYMSEVIEEFYKKFIA